MAALLVSLALIAPSVARLVCDVGCVHADPHVTLAASDEGCHQERPSSRPNLAVTSTDDGCHADNDAVASAVATERQAVKEALLVVRLQHALIANRTTRPLNHWNSSLSPPAIVLITTQLRI